MLAYLPSPDRGVWMLGPVPIRAYALCIIAGIVVAVLWGEKRFVARGGEPGTVTDVAVYAVPFGLDRGPALPRPHRLDDLLRSRGQPDRRPEDLARRPGDLGGGRPRRGRGVDRLPAPRRAAAVLRRRRRARHRHRAGDRAAGQLVQPGALRRPDDAAVGPGDLPPGRPGHGDHGPARRRRRRPHPDRGRAAHVPLRAAVEPARRRAGGVGGPAVPARARARLRRLRRRVHARPLLHRADAHGPGDARVRRHPDQRGGRRRRVRRRDRLPAAGAQAARGAAVPAARPAHGRGARRDARPAHAAESDEPGRPSSRPPGPTALRQPAPAAAGEPPEGRPDRTP